MNGFGREIFNDKSHYTGFFKDGLRHGQGKFVNIDGNIKNGTWEFGSFK